MSLISGYASGLGLAPIFKANVVGGVNRSDIKVRVHMDVSGHYFLYASLWVNGLHYYLAGLLSLLRLVAVTFN